MNLLRKTFNRPRPVWWFSRKLQLIQLRNVGWTKCITTLITPKTKNKRQQTNFRASKLKIKKILRYKSQLLPLLAQSRKLKLQLRRRSHRIAVIIKSQAFKRNQKQMYKDYWHKPTLGNQRQSARWTQMKTTSTQMNFKTIHCMTVQDKVVKARMEEIYQHRKKEPFWIHQTSKNTQLRAQDVMLCLIRTRSLEKQSKTLLINSAERDQLS